MVKVIIKGAGDEKLNGLWVTEKSRFDSFTEGKSRDVIIRKLKKNGEVSKQREWFPFKSYHNSRAIRDAYRQRNSAATMELLEVIKPTELIKDVLYFNNNQYVIKLDEKEFHGKFHNSMSPSKTIWLDDESETYLNWRSYDAETKKNIWMWKFAKNIFINPVKSDGSYYWDLLKVSSQTDEAETQIEKQRFAASFRDTETANAIYDKLQEAVRIEYNNLSQYYDRYIKEPTIRGYWANR